MPSSKENANLTLGEVFGQTAGSFETHARHGSNSLNTSANIGTVGISLNAVNSINANRNSRLMLRHVSPLVCLKKSQGSLVKVWNGQGKTS